MWIVVVEHIPMLIIDWFTNEKKSTGGLLVALDEKD
jgi:hypothetical protein